METPTLGRVNPTPSGREKQELSKQADNLFISLLYIQFLALSLLFKRSPMFGRTKDHSTWRLTFSLPPPPPTPSVTFDKLRSFTGKIPCATVVINIHIQIKYDYNDK